MESILLASGSERRRELLESLSIPYICAPSDIDESIRDSLPPSERVLALAEDKARASVAKLARGAPRLVLAADTLVCLPAQTQSGEELALGKPADLDQARRMMLLLSGRTHYVRTGLYLLDRLSGQGEGVRSDSLVEFAPMSEDEISAYLAMGEWEGVAGAYRIQGLAALYITKLEGSWSGVVGLPLRELYVILRQADYRF
jgi:septum formation protein